MVMIEDDVERVARTSNYIAWFSHGQLRKEGSLKQVLPLYRDHEIDRTSLETAEEKENFDVDWKSLGHVYLN